MIQPVDPVKKSRHALICAMQVKSLRLVVAAIWIIASTLSLPASQTATPAQPQALQVTSPADSRVQSRRTPDESRTLLFSYIAVAAWLALLCAGTLAILIMAHKISTAQSARKPKEL